MPYRVGMRLAIRMRSKAALKAWADCVSIATAMVDGSFKPIGKRWTNYCRVDCMVAWRWQMKDVKQIGEHVFGRLEA